MSRSVADQTTLCSEIEALEGLRKPGRDGSASLREFPRSVVRGMAELFPMSRLSVQDQPVEVQLRDVGRGGVGFIANVALEPGSTWRIVFKRDGYRIGEMGLVVRFCKEVRADVFLVGSQFVITSALMHLLGVNSTDIELSTVARRRFDPAADGAGDAGHFLPASDVA